jgi:uncharacterized protein DUF1203
MSFLISALPVEPFTHLFGEPDAVLAGHGARRLVANRKPGFPCRVSLRDAEVGESVLLVNYEHLPAASPYRSRYAIFVREHALPARLQANEVPEQLRSRLLSLRAFDSEAMLIAAEVIEGSRIEAVIEQLLASPRAAWLHVHNAKPGCYAARVDRVPEGRGA